MGWFDRHIHDINDADQEFLEESLYVAASVAMGNKHAEYANADRKVTKIALDEILKYYHFKPVEIPDRITDADEQMEYCLRPYRIMRRSVRLDRYWYKNAYGPLLIFKVDTGEPVAAIPGKSKGYYYTDRDTGMKIRIDRTNIFEFGPAAITFYKPLPDGNPGLLGLIAYMNDCVSTLDKAVIVGGTALVMILGMFFPYLTRFMTGSVIMSKNKVLLMSTAMFLIGTVISRQLLELVKKLSVARFLSKGPVQLNAAVMIRLLNLPSEFFRRHSAGELSSRFENLTHFGVMLIRDVIANGLACLMSLIYVFQISKMTPVLAVPALIIIVLMIFENILSSIIQSKVNKKVMNRDAKTSGLAFALINGIQKIKLSGAEKRVFAKWLSHYSKEVNSKYNSSVYLKLSKGIKVGLTIGGMAVIYYIAYNAELTPSEFMTFMAAYGMIAGVYPSIELLAASIAKIEPSYEMIKPILDEELETSTSSKIVTNLTGNIELSNVYFRYSENSPWIVNSMSLSIKPGEYVAIVGKTGCGKSTLLRLLLGFETPERGAIYYDRMDMRWLDKRSLRHKIGAVIQTGSLYPGDIYSNISLSAPGLSMEDAWEAAEIAGIADDIRAMPMQMHTEVSEGQGGISGGQKQRILIARAIAPKPRILFFDEATSALDNKTQKKVSEALDKMNCTRIVIAHRLSTIRNCDRILYLEDGVVKEDGTYDELIARNGSFAELVNRQRLDS